MSTSVLIIDDEPSFRLVAEEALVSDGFEVSTVGRLNEARRAIEAAMPDVIVLDRRLPDGDGLSLLEWLPPPADRSTVVIVVTAYGDVENAVATLQAGAADYLTKPVQLTDLVVKLRKAVETRGLRDQLHLAHAHASGAPTVEPLSASMRSVNARLAQVARSAMTPVFLRGPSGVGKQRAAERLHALTYGPRSAAPFVDLNCAALPEDLVESELFGHEKGAFTDASAARRGLIEMAGGGTLFLDEVAELPLRSQAKLLKFLDSLRFRRLGGQREISVELRVVAATNQDSHALVRAGKFREDLYHRLSVFDVEIPPLRSRREDIPPLAHAFAHHFRGRVKKRDLTLTDEALAALMQYDYPGNVRELSNIVERAVILAPGREVTAAHIVLPRSSTAHGAESTFAGSPAAAPETTGDAPPWFFSTGLESDGTPPRLEDVERDYVARVVAHCQGHRTAAAAALGISYPTFLRRLRELGLDR